VLQCAADPEGGVNMSISNSLPALKLLALRQLGLLRQIQCLKFKGRHHKSATADPAAIAAGAAAAEWLYEEVFINQVRLRKI
jgi:hypothetical protein